MSIVQERRIEFSQPVRQIVLMVIVLILVGIGVAILYRHIAAVFNANQYLNGFIGGVFVIGVLACFWQVVTLISAVSWLEGFAIDRPGHEFVNPPRLLTSLASLLRDRRARASLNTTSTRSILDSVATRLDEQRDITRYIVNLLILVGLLGTFWGLSNVVPGIVETMRSLGNPESGGSLDVFGNLMEGLNTQLDGMGTAFASSLLGLAGSLVVGLLDLFASHGQNRFYRELEEWLSSITRISFSSDGDASGGGGAIATELMDRNADQIDTLVQVFRDAEEKRAENDARIATLTDSVAQLARRMGTDHDALAAVARSGGGGEGLETGRKLDRIAAAQERIAALLEKSEGHETDAESRLRLRNIDMQLARIYEEVSAGRQDTTAEIRMDLARLTKAITGGGASGPGA